jgi:hypothetical protein
MHRKVRGIFILIYIALMAITVDRIGIDFYEFGPEKVYTDDFGID